MAHLCELQIIYSHDKLSINEDETNYMPENIIKICIFYLNYMFFYLAEWRTIDELNIW